MLTSWQAHGAKLEAVRAEFQTDPQSIRDVLRVWQLHGDRINAFLNEQGVDENGGTGRLSSPSGRALNGAPLCRMRARAGTCLASDTDMYASQCTAVRASRAFGGRKVGGHVGCHHANVLLAIRPQCLVKATCKICWPMQAMARRA